MADEPKLNEVLEALRKSDSAKGRTYSSTGVEPEWLVKETSEHCKSQGWENTLSSLPDGKTWLVVSDSVAVLIEGTSDQFAVTVGDTNPVMLKTALVANGLLTLTGLGIVGLPMAGATVWRASARKSKVSALVKFVDDRIQAQGKAPPVVGKEEPKQSQPPAGSVAERLKALAGLKKQGLVTEEEYEAKRQELIKQL